MIRPNLSDSAAASLDSAAGEPAHLEMLRILEQHPDYSQRELAAALGVSLGKTHYLLRALLARGWVKVQNFQRSDTKLAYLYVLTPQGVKQRFRLTQLFLERKQAEYDMLKDQIGRLRAELSALAPHGETAAMGAVPPAFVEGPAQPEGR